MLSSDDSRPVLELLNHVRDSLKSIRLYIAKYRVRRRDAEWGIEHCMYKLTDCLRILREIQHYERFTGDIEVLHQAVISVARALDAAEPEPIEERRRASKIIKTIIKLSREAEHEVMMAAVETDMQELKALIEAGKDDELLDDDMDGPDDPDDDPPFDID